MTIRLFACCHFAPISLHRKLKLLTFLACANRFQFVYWTFRPHCGTTFLFTISSHYSNTLISWHRIWNLCQFQWFFMHWFFSLQLPRLQNVWVCYHFCFCLYSCTLIARLYCWVITNQVRFHASLLRCSQQYQSICTIGTMHGFFPHIFDAVHCNSLLISLARDDFKWAKSCHVCIMHDYQ